MKISIAVAVVCFAASVAAAESPGIFSEDGKYLGTLSANKYDPESVNNPYGQYGNKFNPDSIKSPYGQYGNPYSDTSVNNPYATSAPHLESGDKAHDDD